MKMFRAKQSGFTLIELMIAMLLGVFLTAGILQIFSSSKQAYRLQENLSRLQENGRFAIDLITKNVRMAGYTGCSSTTTPNVIASPRTPPMILTLGVAVGGIDNVSSSNWDSSACSSECIVNTDVLNFQSSTSCNAQLQGNMSVPNANIQINPACTPTLTTNCNTCGIQASDIVIISNCTSTDIFAATNASAGGSQQTIAHANNVNIDNRLSTTYSTDAEIYSPKLLSYFIRKGAGGVPALWRIDSTRVGSTPDELIEGIENMQVLYGVDNDPVTDNVADFYLTATGVNGVTVTLPDATTATGWSRVISVRVNLLAVTIENNLTDTPQSYTYDGITYGTTTPLPQIAVVKTDTSKLCQRYTSTLPSNCQMVDDRRIHRVFSSTIAVRNRLP